MAYAYLFKYIIIGDTGKRRGRGGEARRPRESGGRAGGAESRARLPAPISAVLASSTWWPCAKRRLPPPLRLCAGPRPGPRPASRRLRARRPWAPPPGPEA